MPTFVLIPAYKPTDRLPELLRELAGAASTEVAGVHVVDDGSGAEFGAIFEACATIPNVVVHRHAVNLGKGAALKTGINAICAAHPEAEYIVTADADGQHAPADIAKVARAALDGERAMVLGVREFDGHVPLRSRFGNVLTRQVLRIMTGTSLTDTQTGLRAIPREYALDMLRIPLNGYDFEMECIVRLRTRSGGRIRQVPIQTIYIDDNRGSHFNPLLDSMRIYFVFLRYCFGSALTFAVDYGVFIAMLAAAGSIGLAIAVARVFATFVSFFANRNLVFQSRGNAGRAFAKFILLVIAFGFISYLSTSWLVEAFGWHPVSAKFVTELVLFVAGFAANSTIIFRVEETPTATDWDAYYRRPFPATSFTRKVSERRLIRRMREFRRGERVRMVELGGANSCFAAGILEQEPVDRYDIFDLNDVGLERTLERFGADGRVRIHRANLLHESPTVRGNVVMSVGLIEHFDPPETAIVVQQHFAAAEPGALVIMTFPTPTWLYRSIRGAAEILRIWKFHDERPMWPEEVLAAVGPRGELLSSETNWAIGLTQQIMVFRVREAA